jgi:hypothetical protein
MALIQLSLILPLTLLVISLSLINANRPISFCDLPPQNPTTANYLLNDDFDQPSLNRSIWHVIQSDNKYTYDFASGRKALSTPANVYLEDGDLIFHAKRETKPSPTIADLVFDFTTGGVSTKDRVVFDLKDDISMTRVCVRALPPSGIDVQDGDKWVDSGGQLWPAFWTLTNNARTLGGPVPVGPLSGLSSPFDEHLDQFDTFSTDEPVLPANTTSTLLMNREENQSWDEKEPNNMYVCNPDGGEADFFERYGSRPQYDIVYHYQRDTDQVVCNYPKKHGAVYGTFKIDRSIYHEYAIERGKDYIDYVLDGEVVKRVVNTEETQELPIAFNKTTPWMLYMNLALSGVPGKYFPEEGFKMRIDYVKIVTYTEVMDSYSSTIVGVIAAIGAIGGVVVIGLIAYFSFKLRTSEHTTPLTSKTSINN